MFTPWLDFFNSRGVVAAGNRRFVAGTQNVHHISAASVPPSRVVIISPEALVRYEQYTATPEVYARVYIISYCSAFAIHMRRKLPPTTQKTHPATFCSAGKPTERPRHTSLFRYPGAYLSQLRRSALLNEHRCRDDLAPSGDEVWSMKSLGVLEKS